MPHTILTLNDFMVSTRATTTNWAVQTGVTTSFTTDFTVSGPTAAAFTGVVLTSNQFEYSTNSVIQVTGINCPISVEVASISGTSVILYGRSASSSFASTSLQTDVAAWTELAEGSQLLVDNNQFIGFGVYKVSAGTATISFKNASASGSPILGDFHTF